MNNSSNKVDASTQTETCDTCGLVQCDDECREEIYGTNFTSSGIELFMSGGHSKWYNYLFYLNEYDELITEQVDAEGTREVHWNEHPIIISAQGVEYLKFEDWNYELVSGETSIMSRLVPVVSKFKDEDVDEDAVPFCLRPIAYNYVDASTQTESGYMMHWDANSLYPLAIYGDFETFVSQDDEQDDPKEDEELENDEEELELEPLYCESCSARF